MVAEHSSLDAYDVLDRDVGTPDRGGEAAVGIRAREPVKLVVDAVIGRRELRVGAGDEERARDPAVAGGEGDRVGGLVLEPVDDGGEVGRPLRAQKAGFPIGRVKDLERVGHWGGSLSGKVELVLSQTCEGVASGVGDSSSRDNDVVGDALPEVGGRVDSEGGAAERDLRSVADGDGADVAGPVRNRDDPGPGPHRFREGEDDVSRGGNRGGVTGRSGRDERRTSLVEPETNDDRVVIGFARHDFGVEDARVAAEIEVVVEGVGLVGVDVPFGDAGDLAVQAAIGEAVVEGAVGGVEDVGIGVGEAVLGEVGEAVGLKDVEGVLLDVGVEVPEQQGVGVGGAGGIEGNPFRERRGGELALLLPASLAIALVGVCTRAAAALRFEVVDDGREVFARSSFLEGHRQRGAAGVHAIEDRTDRALSQQSRVEGRDIAIVELFDRGVHRHVDLTRLVDEAYRDRVAAEELALVELVAGIDPGVGACPRLQVELADEIFQRVAGIGRLELVLELGQAEHVGAGGDQRVDELAGLTVELGGVVCAARLEADSGVGAVGVQGAKVVEDVEAADLEAAADVVGRRGAGVGLDEGGVAVVDGADPVGAGGAVAEHAGEVGHGVAHPGGGGGVVATKAVEVRDRLVLSVEPVVVHDRAGAALR